MQTMSLIQGLIARGHSITFLGSCPTLLTLCQQIHVPHEHLEIGEPPVSFWRSITFLWRQFRMRRRLIEALDRLHKKEPIDALCMLSFSEKLLLTPAAVIRDIPVFWIEHDAVGRWLTHNPFLTKLLRLSRSVTTIGVSQMSRELYISMGWPRERVVAIPNGIDPARFSQKTHEHRKSAGRLQVGTVARLAQEKGVDVLIEAVRTMTDTELTIVGIGPQQQALLQQIANADIGDRVHLLPHLGNLGDFYAELDVFVLPSRRHDPFGLVAAEAMIVGTPTIVTEACGIARELEADVEAVVVKPDSASALRKALRDLLDNPQRRSAMARAGKRKATFAFTHDVMVDRYEELLKASRLH